MSLLTINNLRVHFYQKTGVNKAIDGISLTINKSEVVALVGASGSGKSLTALSILQLLPDTATLQDGQIIFEGKDLLKIPKRQMRDIRGSKISIIFQEPKSALNPVFNIGYQLKEVLKTHTKLDEPAIRKRISDTLKNVGLTDVERILYEYPHQLSGGMCQRTMIAQSLLMDSQLLIADEPTSNLDVTLQAQILELLREIKTRTNLSILLISHDLRLVSCIADRIAVMRSGQIVEQGETKEIFNNPKHPYTKELIEASSI